MFLSDLNLVFMLEVRRFEELSIMLLSESVRPL